MLKIIFYILYNGWKIEEPRFNSRNLQRLQTVFIAQQCIFFVILFLIPIDKYFNTKSLNWIKLLTHDIKTVRLFVMVFVISIIIIYNYFTIFRKDVREQILIQYRGKFKTLIKYHNVISFILLLLPFILIYLFDN
ncbi:hypothetical protein [Flavobacterium sp.]|uniref:hypothetical protein n=1 Tax=Flavobacterium sp. TaxID=239 RepID=UPI0035AEF078